MVIPSSLKQKFNIQLGVGIKFPTGNYNYQDYFYRNDSTKVLSAVNPGIQLGDGGTGIITEANTFYQINNKMSVYGNVYYLISPRELNGTTYTVGRTPTDLQMKTGEIYNSVPDVFSIRAGGIINVNKFSFSAGIRNEGSPVYDLIGGSNGGRRAGYYFSIEPGILYTINKITAYAYLPIVVDRRIKQNVADKRATEITGVNTTGPGGSANFMVLTGISFKL